MGRTVKKCPYCGSKDFGEVTEVTWDDDKLCETVVVFCRSCRSIISSKEKE